MSMTKIKRLLKYCSYGMKLLSYKKKIAYNFFAILYFDFKNSALNFSTGNFLKNEYNNKK